MDLDIMSVVRGPDEDGVPCGFTVFAWGMADGDDHKSSLVCIITLDQGKRSLCEQTLAGLVLKSARSVSIWFVGEAELTNWEKSSCTLPS